jgi:serine phosphatase RsbU (regulator of sigma subunit)
MDQNIAYNQPKKKEKKLFHESRNYLSGKINVFLGFSLILSVKILRIHKNPAFMIRLFQIIFLIITFFRPVFSQQIFTDSRMKAEYTLLYSSYVEWPDSVVIDKYRIGVLGSMDIFNELKFKSQNEKFKGKAFEVGYFRKIKDIKPVQILYVSKESNEEIKKIWTRINNQPVLMITDSCPQFEFVMINLLTILGRSNKPFEINNQNIHEAGLEVSPKILYIGGREDELRDIYRQSEKQLETVKNEIEILNKDLVVQYEKLEQRIREVDSLNQQIIGQKNELNLLTGNIRLQQKSLDEKTVQLQEQEISLKELLREIGKKENQLRMQQDSIMSGKQILSSQKDSIQSQQEKIRRQQSVLGEQTVKIERQRYLLYFALLLILFISGIVFLILRAYRIKRSANRILRDKNAAIAKQNAEISKQKEEILAQREQLEIINKAIEKQNEDIKASIYYALTIQNAMLPIHQEIIKYHNYFIIYLPKDIVAGDFYWFTHIHERKKNCDMSFFAVVDCTGHGVPAGFLSMIGSRLLGTIVNENRIFEPDKILRKMDKSLRAALRQEHTEIDDGMDVCLCRIEKERNPDGELNGKVKLVFSGARRPLYILNRNGIELIRGDRKTIGGRFNEGLEFTNKEFLLNRGDRIFLTTDGITDQNSPERDKFGIDRLTGILSGTHDLAIDKQKQSLEEELLGFMKYEKQRDDITVLGIEL